MAVKRWSDENAAGNRLAAHRLTTLLSLDLEGSESIGAIGAIRTDRSATFTWRGKNGGLRSALAELDEFADGASHLVGHNIIEHDLALLARHAPDLKLLGLPAIDTLYLSPLAYPENPYHHLVKQYQEPALARVQINDPLLDAELTLELLADVADKLKRSDGGLLLAWHALLATGVKGHGFDHFFQLIRGSIATPIVENSIPAIGNRLAERGCPRQAAPDRSQCAGTSPRAHLSAGMASGSGGQLHRPSLRREEVPTERSRSQPSRCALRRPRLPVVLGSS